MTKNNKMKKLTKRKRRKPSPLRPEEKEGSKALQMSIHPRKKEVRKEKKKEKEE